MGKHSPDKSYNHSERYQAGLLLRTADQVSLSISKTKDYWADLFALGEYNTRYVLDAFKDARNPNAALALGVTAVAPIASVEIVDVENEVIRDNRGEIISIAGLERKLADAKPDNFSPEAHKDYRYRTARPETVPAKSAPLLQAWERRGDGPLKLKLKAGRFPGETNKRTTLYDFAERLIIPGGWPTLHAQNPQIENPDQLLSGITEINITIEKPLAYTIRPGDTLSSLADRTGVFTASELASINNIADPDQIQAGATLVIPFETKGWTVQTIKVGDTLGDYGYAVDGSGGVGAKEIARMNFINDPDIILAGASILLPAGIGETPSVTAQTDQPKTAPEPAVDSDTKPEVPPPTPESDAGNQPEAEVPPPKSPASPEPETEPETMPEPETPAQEEPPVPEKPPAPEAPPKPVKPAPGTVEVMNHYDAMHEFTDGFIQTGQQLRKNPTKYKQLVEGYVEAEAKGKTGQFLLNLRDAQLKAWADKKAVKVEAVVSDIVGDIVVKQGLEWENISPKRQKLWLAMKPEIVNAVLKGKSLHDFEQEFSAAMATATALHDMLAETTPNVEPGLAASTAAERAISVIAQEGLRQLVVGEAKWIADNSQGRATTEGIIGARILYGLAEEADVPLSPDVQVTEEQIEKLGQAYIDGRISFSELDITLEHTRNEVQAVFDLFHRYTARRSIDKWPNQVQPTLPGEEVVGKSLDDRVIRILDKELTFTQLRDGLAEFYAGEYGVDVKELYRVMSWYIMHDGSVADATKDDLDDGLARNLHSGKITLNDIIKAADSTDIERLEELAGKKYKLPVAGEIATFLPANAGPVNSEGYMAMPESLDGLWKFEGFTPKSDRCLNPIGVGVLNTTAIWWREAGYPALVFGDMNAWEGHVSHMNGVDIDLDSVKRGFAAGDMTKPGYDKDATLLLAQRLTQTGYVEKIFYNDLWVAEEFNKWAESNGYEARMSWVDNHHHHFHVRLNVPKGIESGICAPDTIFEGDGSSPIDKPGKGHKGQNEQAAPPKPELHKKLLDNLVEIRVVSRSEIVGGDWGTKLDPENFVLALLAATAEGNKPKWQNRDRLIDIAATFWHESANGYVNARGDTHLGHGMESNGICQMLFAPKKSWGAGAMRLPENNINIWQHLNNCYLLYTETGSMAAWMANKRQGGPSADFEPMFAQIIDRLLESYDLDW